MKITKKFLREMILLEIGDYIDPAQGVGGKEMTRSDFQSTKFKDSADRIMGFLDAIEANVRKGEPIGDDELKNLKDVCLTTLFGKIEEIEGAITKNGPAAFAIRAGPRGRGLVTHDEPHCGERFARNIMMIVPLFDKMKKDVASNAQYKKQDLEYFKNNYLNNITRKIGFLNSVIEARLSHKFDAQLSSEFDEVE